MPPAPAARREREARLLHRLGNVIAHYLRNGRAITLPGLGAFCVDAHAHVRAPRAGEWEAWRFVLSNAFTVRYGVQSTSPLRSVGSAPCHDIPWIELARAAGMPKDRCRSLLSAAIHRFGLHVVSLQSKPEKTVAKLRFGDLGQLLVRVSMFGSKAEFVFGEERQPAAAPPRKEVHFSEGGVVETAEPLPEAAEAELQPLEQAEPEEAEGAEQALAHADAEVPTGDEAMPIGCDEEEPSGGDEAMPTGADDAEPTHAKYARTPAVGPAPPASAAAAGAGAEATVEAAIAEQEWALQRFKPFLSKEQRSARREADEYNRRVAEERIARRSVAVKHAELLKKAAPLYALQPAPATAQAATAPREPELPRLEAPDAADTAPGDAPEAAEVTAPAGTSQEAQVRELELQRGQLEARASELEALLSARAELEAKREEGTPSETEECIRRLLAAEAAARTARRREAAVKQAKLEAAQAKQEQARKHAFRSVRATQLREGRRAVSMNAAQLREQAMRAREERQALRRSIMSGERTPTFPTTPSEQFARAALGAGPASYRRSPLR